MSSVSDSSSDELPKFELFGDRFYRSIGISIADFDPDGALYTYLFSFDEDDETNSEFLNASANSLNNSTNNSTLQSPTQQATNQTSSNNHIVADSTEDHSDGDDDLSAGGGVEEERMPHNTQTSFPISLAKKVGHSFDVLQAIYQVTAQLLVNDEERKAIIRYVLWFINLSMKNQDTERRAIANSIKRDELQNNLIDIGFNEEAPIIKFIDHIYQEGQTNKK